MRERRHLGKERRLDVLPCDEEVDGLDAPGNEVLPFDSEQPKLVPPAPVAELADELEPFVVARVDQAGWLNAALACSAIALNAAGSLTARSASTFRSSSIPAFVHPCTNWL